MGTGEGLEGVVEAAPAAPVLFVVRLRGHVSNQLLDVVLIAEQHNPIVGCFGAEHEPLRVAVEPLKAPQRGRGVGRDQHPARID